MLGTGPRQIKARNVQKIRLSWLAEAVRAVGILIALPGLVAGSAKPIYMHRDLHGSEVISNPFIAHDHLLSPSDRFRRSNSHTRTFRNPILPAPSADPWIIQHEGQYYYCESRLQGTIWIRRSKSLIDFNQDDGTMVWNAPALGPNSKSLWAPELHLIDGKWIIYYAADDGLNENHRMWVLEGLTNDPCGPYRCRGVLETSGWAIDGTVLQTKRGNYFIWSGWPGKENGHQNLYIAAMSSAWTLSSPRVLLASPDQSWERVDMPICEGPQMLQRGGRTFLIYSASGSWTTDYCLGLIELTGPDPLNPQNWRKHGCVFQKTDYVWGLGHCSFVQSPDQSEDWIVYHAKSKLKKGWNDRNVRAQRFTWTDEGLPNFGSPIPAGVSIPIPSGDPLTEVGV
jgi:GH43 family beta-xylosidase